MVLVLVIVLIWGQDLENVFPARETLHNKNYGNPSYRYYRQWFTDYKGPEPEGLCIDLKKKRIRSWSINQLVNQNYNQTITNYN